MVEQLFFCFSFLP